ncbi:MAG: sulfite exporter TauE/SafE family protein, partial [Oxalobacteraceae bacterium]|nr:sulfite exporter TauE/SafE family protein [Oxalobacteraceae bacterium]
PRATLPALIACSLASLLTAQFGAKTAHRMQVASLKKAFALLLVVLALYMGTLAF